MVPDSLYSHSPARSITGHVYTGLVDGRVIKVDLQKETYSLVARMGDPPYDKCGK